MDWMYKGISGIVDREEYLTGRKIDKTFELIDREENPASYRNNDNSIIDRIENVATDDGQAALSKNDLVAKMREDPLYEIKMKQIEQRKHILKNPVKLKQLEEALKVSLENDKKKHKKSKKHKNKKSKKSHRDHSSSDSDSGSSEPEKIVKKHKSSHHSEHRSSSDHHHHNHRHSSERSTSDRSHKRHSDHKSSTKVDSKYRSDSSRKPYTYRSSQHHQSGSARKPKLSEEEMRKRREDMMQNAKWREVTRTETVNKLEKEEKHEEEMLKNRDANANFIKPMLSSMASNSSIESSLKQKRFKLQHGHDSMNVNFARKS